MEHDQTNSFKPRRSAGLSATAAAGAVTGALVIAANGAALSTDLVVNGGFESIVSTTAIGADFTGWTGGNLGSASANTPFGYNYAANYDNRSSGVVPPGNLSSSSSDYYWSMNGYDENAFQTIDLSTGDTGAAILGGTAVYELSAFFSGYLTHLETGRVSTQFYDSGNVLIGSPIHTDGGNDFWNAVSSTASIPANAAGVVITLTRNPASGLTSGPDAYIDNVSFVVNSIPEPSALLLSFAATGLLALRRKRQ